MAVYTVLLRADVGEVPGAAEQRQSAGAGRWTAAATSPSGTTLSPSRAICSPWSQPTSSRVTSASSRATASEHLLQIFVKPRRPRPHRTRDERR
jgi:hypothetical protein